MDNGKYANELTLAILSLLLEDETHLLPPMCSRDITLRNHSWTFGTPCIFHDSTPGTAI
jgi:hypothetical protein